MRVWQEAWVFLLFSGIQSPRLLGIKHGTWHSHCQQRSHRFHGKSFLIFWVILRSTLVNYIWVVEGTNLSVKLRFEWQWQSAICQWCLSEKPLEWGKCWISEWLVTIVLKPKMSLGNHWRWFCGFSLLKSFSSNAFLHLFLCVLLDLKNTVYPVFH